MLKGHYIAFVRSAVTGTWWEFDDDLVQRVDADREDVIAVEERKSMDKYKGWQEVPLHAREFGLDGWDEPVAIIGAKAAAKIRTATATSTSHGTARDSQATHVQTRGRSRSTVSKRRGGGNSSPAATESAIPQLERLQKAAASAALEQDAIAHRL